MSTWFVAVEEKVSGPFDVDTVRQGLESGNIPDTCRLWTRGNEHWITKAEWAHAMTEVETAERETSEQEWHYAIEGVSKGPVSRTELIQIMTETYNKDTVLLWTKGMKSWADLYEFDDIREELGLDRRGTPRSPISGSVDIKFDNGEEFTANLKSIGTGGVGIFGSHEHLKEGTEVHIELRSDFLSEVIRAVGIVHYTTESGYAGLSFKGISDEAKAHITSYIRTRTGKADQAA